MRILGCRLVTMTRLFFRWLVTTLTILMVPHLISGVHVEGLGTALAAAAILSVLNLLVRPILLVLTFPLTLLSLGFFILFINALMFQWASALAQGMRVDSFGSAFLAALVVSVVTWVMHFSFEQRDGKRVIVIRGRGAQRTVDLNRTDKERWE